MTDKTPASSSSTTLACALLLGLTWHAAGTWLPPQASLVAKFALLFTVVAALARAGALASPEPDRLLLGVPALLFMGALLWRDAEALVALNTVALVVLAGLAVPGTAARALASAGAGHWLERLARAGAGTAVGAIPAGWHALRRAESKGPWRKLAAPTVGLLAVSPVLVVFAALLGEADPLFGEVLRSTFSLDLRGLGPDVAAVAAGTWLAAGLLWAMARPVPVEVPYHVLPRVPADAVVAALVAIEALFGLFVVLQSRYLFGGLAHVQATAGLTVAEYARRGFFELVAVAALSLPVLMLAEWAVDVARRDDRRRLWLHAIAVLAMLGLMLASAASRMLLYTSLYGLTESRLYVTVFMAWVGVVLAWFALTSLRGVRHRFMTGAFAAAVQALLLLNLMNPDAIIVRVNVAREAAGRPFDAAYVSRLGAGALPALLARAERLPEPVRCQVLDAQRARLDRAPGRRARWNVERARAAGPLRVELERAAARACGVRN